MSSYKFLFNLSFDKLLYSTNLHGFQFNFFNIKKNKNLILIGHSSKDLKKGNRQQSIKKIIKNDFIWNKIESESLNLMLNKIESYRLTEWILIRILSKLGLLLYWKECNIDFQISIKHISLQKNQLSKPFIKVFSNNNSIADSIPFVSVSHSKKDVFIALCIKPVGIDTELVENHSEAWKKRIFTKQEIKTLINFLKRWKNLAKETIYTIIWSLKESTIKIQDNMTLGSLPEINISIANNNIVTKTPKNNIFYHNYISINDNSVLILTI